jgi:hypothetical protein
VHSKNSAASGEKSEYHYVGMGVNRNFFITVPAKAKSFSFIHLSSENPAIVPRCETISV